MTKRQVAAMHTRKKLIEAGQKLINEKGFESVCVEDITNECGVAKGTFYTYFQRKEDIVPELTRQPFEQLMIEVRERKDETLSERLKYYMFHFMEAVEESGIQICRQWICQVVDPNNVPAGRDGKKLAYDTDALRNLLKEWVQEGELSKDTPVETLTNTMISELYGMMICWCMSDGNFEPKEWIERFFDVQFEPVYKKYYQ